jgi:ferredoxin
VVADEVRLRVNPIECDGRGLCADLLPELITLDDWGFPIIAEGPVPEELHRLADRTVTACPRLALLLERTRTEQPANGRGRGA